MILSFYCNFISIINKKKYYVTQIFYDFTRISLRLICNGLESCLNSPPRPHAFLNSPLLSSGIKRHREESASDDSDSNLNSPLDQFEIRDLLSIGLLDYFYISLTNIGFYLSLSFFILINLNILCIATRFTATK